MLDLTLKKQVTNYCAAEISYIISIKRTLNYNSLLDVIPEYP